MKPNVRAWLCLRQAWSITALKAFFIWYLIAWKYPWKYSLMARKRLLLPRAETIALSLTGVKNLPGIVGKISKNTTRTDYYNSLSKKTSVVILGTNIESTIYEKVQNCSAWWRRCDVICWKWCNADYRDDWVDRPLRLSCIHVHNMSKLTYNTILKLIYFFGTYNFFDQML